MTSRVGERLAMPQRLTISRHEAARVRTLVGLEMSPAIGRRLDPILPSGSDFASALRMQIELARLSGREA
jgi:hypothetical protein